MLKRLQEVLPLDSFQGSPFAACTCRRRTQRGFMPTAGGFVVGVCCCRVLAQVAVAQIADLAFEKMVYKLKRNEWFVATYNRLFQQVFQLSDVTWPRKRLEDFDRSC